MDQLNVIFPVYNEVESIEAVLKEWHSMLVKTKLRFHLVVCEDGSKDGTTALLKKIQKKYRLILNQKKVRRGYGGAVIDGITTAQSEFILCVDSDGQCDPNDFKKFWKLRNQSQVLIGWRTQRADANQRKLFSNLFKMVFMMMFPVSIHDPSAPFVLFRKKTIMPHLPYLAFLKEGFWWGFIGMCVKKGLTVTELPINHRDRFAGDTQVYQLPKIPDIAVRNLLGLGKLWLAK